MSSRLRSWAVGPALLAPLLVVAGGCTDDKKTESPAATASAEQGPRKAVLDGKLAAAVKAAESARAASPKADDGPPESGVFAPGLADKALAPGAPPKVEVMGNGNEPRVVLTPAPADEQKVTVGVTVRIQGAVIPIEYTLALKVDKPKDEKKDDKKAEGPKAVHVTGKVTAIGLPPQMPRDAADKLGKLKGSEVHYTLGPDGAISDVGTTLSKDADQSLTETMLSIGALSDAISGAGTPLPKTPIGVGGSWIATDRAPSALGVEVVRYRVYNVEKIDKDSATLAVTVRRYAAKEEASLGALAPNMPKLNLQRFESTGKGKLDWTAAGLLPARGESSLRTAFQGPVGNDAQGQQQMAGLQVEVGIKLSSEAGDKKK